MSVNDKEYSNGSQYHSVLTVEDTRYILRTYVKRMMELYKSKFWVFSEEKLEMISEDDLLYPTGSMLELMLYMAVTMKLCLDSGYN